MAPEDLARVLVVAAHPDDVDFGAAGTVARWTDDGVEVSYCIVTDGDAGGFDEAVPRSEIAGIRRAEQLVAAAIVGVTDVVFLGYPDGRVEATMQLRRDLSREIRRVRPQVVVTPSPERRWDRIYASHPDHLAVGESAVAAVYPDSRNPFAHPELAAAGYEAYVVDELWLLASPTPNRWVDVTDTIDRKLAALHAHASQHPDPEGLDERVREWSAAHGGAGGMGSGRFAEAFQVINTR